MTGIAATSANTTNSIAVCAPEKSVDRRSGRVYTSKERMGLSSGAAGQATLSGSPEQSMNESGCGRRRGCNEARVKAFVEDRLLLSQKFMKISRRASLGGWNRVRRALRPS